MQRTHRAGPAAHLEQTHCRGADRVPTAGYCRRMEARTRRRIRWVVGLLGAILLALAAMAVTFAVQLGGGWDEVLDRSHPQPGDADVVVAREAGAGRVLAESAAVLDRAVVPSLSGARVVVPPQPGAAVAPSGGSGTGADPWGSQCEVGQHNWKRDDAFDLICTEATGGVVLAQDSSFAADMASLDRALAATGYSPTGPGEGLSRAIGYWADLAGTAIGDGQYGVANLPRASYTSSDGTYLLSVSFSGRGLAAATASAGAAADAQDGEYLVAISVSTTSFRD